MRKRKTKKSLATFEMPDFDEKFCDPKSIAQMKNLSWYFYIAKNMTFC